jgi:hypothetical protein
MFSCTESWVLVAHNWVLGIKSGENDVETLIFDLSRNSPYFANPTHYHPGRAPFLQVPDAGVDGQRD